jgi:hypothetical protein
MAALIECSNSICIEMLRGAEFSTGYDIATSILHRQRIASTISRYEAITQNYATDSE